MLSLGAESPDMHWWMREHRTTFDHLGVLMAITGSQKFAGLLSRFSDDPTADQLPSSDHFRTMLARGRGGLNDYWIDASLGSIDLEEMRLRFKSSSETSLPLGSGWWPSRIQ